MSDRNDLIKKIFEGQIPVIRTNHQTGIPEEIYYNYDEKQGGPVEVYRQPAASNVKYPLYSTPQRYPGAMRKANQYISAIGLSQQFPELIKNQTEKFLEKKKEQHYNRQRFVDPDLWQGNGRQILDNEPDQWDCDQNAIAHNLYGDRGNMDCRGRVGTPREHQQMIVAPDGTIVNSNENMGTYDFVSPQGWARTSAHGLIDVVPWLAWGNNPYDQTGRWERAKGLGKGITQKFLNKNLNQVIWGNGENDPTNMWERMEAYHKKLLRKYLPYESDETNPPAFTKSSNTSNGGFVKRPFQQTPTPWSTQRNNRNYNITSWERNNRPIDGFYNNWNNE